MNSKLIAKRKELKRPLVMDGAIGSLLQSSGEFQKSELWSSLFNLTNPELVEEVHKSYVSAGAEIITTNTFRANPIAVKRFDSAIDIQKLVKAGVELAKNAATGNVLIAGSNPPAEDSYQSERRVNKYDLEYNHKFHIEKLFEAEVDFVLNETQSHFDEIEIICKFCSGNEIPFVVSLFFTEDLKLLSGEPLKEAVQFVRDFSPLAVSVNCVNSPSFEKLRNDKLIDDITAFYLNCGSGNYNDEFISCGVEPDDYIELIRPIDLLSKIFIGSCCGSNPKHTKRIKEFLENGA